MCVCACPIHWVQHVWLHHVLWVPLQGSFTAHYFPKGPGPEPLRNSVFLTSQRLWLTRLCVSTEDKPGEVGIIVALAMLILGTFQWAVITSITVDGLVCSNANTLITGFDCVIARCHFYSNWPLNGPSRLITYCTKGNVWTSVFQHQQTVSGLPLLSLYLLPLTSLHSDSLFLNYVKRESCTWPGISNAVMFQSSG